MRKLLLGLSLLTVGLTTSCEDYFEVESTHYIDADKDHLTTPADTIYSVTGILNKVQAIGDRTILLGEMRGDLTRVTNVTASDLRKVAMFEIDDDNMYNQPRDYYAIINNCNYFIAHADTAMKNNRNEYIFLREYAAVKAIRAWTYLQLVTTYGKVPFVLDPIMTEEDALKDYPQYDINQVCDYFTAEDGLQDLADKGYPLYGDIRFLNSPLFFFPINIVLGDMYLWSGKYWEAAQCYHDYIMKRNGSNSAYPIGMEAVLWASDDYDAETDISYSSYITSMFMNEAYSTNGELITMIPTDSLKSEANYSQLRNIFFSRTENEYEASAMPSQALFELSAAQNFWDYDSRTMTYNLVPKNLSHYADGDLRLTAVCKIYEDETYNGKKISNYIYNYKYNTRNIHIYRRTMIYLRLAEALNRAGYPLYAFKMLATGVDGDVLKEEICPAYSQDSALLVNNMNFSSDKYKVFTPSASDRSKLNTIGIHMHGSGYVMGDTTFVIPQLATLADSIEWVEDKLVDEMALELCFEGTRFYDLMRVSMHRNDPTYLANKVNARNGKDSSSDITVDLTNQSNWFLKWKGQIGY